MGKPVRVLTGERFGKLVAGERAGSRSGNALWLCQCDCGRTSIVSGNQLTRGKTISCGCVGRAGRKPVHGQAGGGRTKLYNTWKSARQRCHNPNNKSYVNYGGRGIEVCERWRHSFQAFATDMGDPPSVAHTIERIDNDGPYSPGNCRWATRAEQVKNQRPTWRTGEGNGRAKLTENDVRAIRLSTLRPSQLAWAYGLALPTVIAVLKRETWRHVD